MAGTDPISPVSVTASLDRDLGELQPITENPSRAGSLNANDADARDFAPGTTTEHPSVEPLASPTELDQDSGPIQELQAASGPRIRESAPTDAHKRRSNRPPRAIARQNTAGLAQGNKPGQPPRRHSTIDTNYSESFEKTKPWDQKAILSLDGGGIRGYSALLILKQLMTKIGKEERNWPPGDDESDGPAETSYHPVDPIQSKATDTASCHSLKGPTFSSESSAWLPCHYFDYIAGTSTGGLIGIMLGRLRMNIDDCITEYENLGDKVFGKSRRCHLRSIPPLWLPREKYNHRVLEEVIQDLVDRRVPKIAGYPGGKNFAFDENRCRVVVVAFQESTQKHAEQPYLFRTYKNLRRSPTTEEREADRNPGMAHDIPIWQVARATSAAPGYFKEVKIAGLRYVDGGFGANNPCPEIFKEVRNMNNHNDDCIQCVVSVGTGKNDQQRITSHTGFKDILKAGLGKFIHYENFARKWASESERSHQDMLNNKRTLNGAFQYHRLNVKSGLGNMKLDEWRCRSKLRQEIGQLIGRIRTTRLPSTESDQDKEKLNRQTVQEEDSTSDTKIPKFFQPKNRTLEKIKQDTLAYLAQETVQQWIDECARQLVSNRRARVRGNKERWQSACFGTWYQCQVHKCPRGQNEYCHRHDMEKHLLDKHRDIHSNKDDEGRRKLEEALQRYKIIVH